MEHNGEFWLVMLVLVVALTAIVPEVQIWSFEFDRGFDRTNSIVYGVVEVLDNYVWEDQLPWDFIHWLLYVESHFRAVG